MPGRRHHDEQQFGSWGGVSTGTSQEGYDQVSAATGICDSECGKKLLERETIPPVCCGVFLYVLIIEINEK